MLLLLLPPPSCMGIEREALLLLLPPLSCMGIGRRGCDGVVVVAAAVTITAAGGGMRRGWWCAFLPSLPSLYPPSPISTLVPLVTARRWVEWVPILKSVYPGLLTCCYC
jgi:hypothetical protein